MANTDPLKQLLESHRDPIAQSLLRLRCDLADGTFLRANFYTVDESKLAGNTHHFWVRLGIDPDPQRALDDLVPEELPDRVANWLTSELDRKIVRRLPREYSTLIKIPFSVELSRVAEQRIKQTELAIAHGLPSTTPYAVFHLEINRLLKKIGAGDQPPSESEFETLFSSYNKNAIAKARIRFPEVWDELRGHYVLDSRGTHFAKALVAELQDRDLLTPNSLFVDVGSGVGTNVFAVNHYSDAHATGIEMHPGIMQITNVMKRRLIRLGLLDFKRLMFFQGDAFDSRIADLGLFDVIYAYSPIGLWEIDIDTVVDRAKAGAVVIFNRLPIRNRSLVEPLKNVAGLYAFRKSDKASEK